MPAFRIGFGSDFSLVNQLVGVGTTAADYKLEVTNVLKGDFNITGVSTLTSYGGFTPQKQSGDDITITTSVATISEDIIVGLGKTFTVSVGATANVGTLESIAVGSHFSFPNGGTSIRPEEPVEGTVRFNNDLNTLEFYNGVEWRQFTVTGASGRGVFGGGTPVANIDFITISTTGNTLNFGTLSVSRRGMGSCASSIRGLFGGGYGPTFSNVIDYITIASEGNAIDFGDLLAANKFACSALSSSTRGIFAGGEPFNNVIEYVQIATIGNSLDFGDLTTNRDYNSSCSSPTRGVFGGGLSSFSAPSGYVKTTEFITISSTGNGVLFGDLTAYRHGIASCSNTTRGIFAGGANPTNDNIIDFVTIASAGNAQDFGDLTQSKSNGGSASTSIRGVFGGGATGSPASTTNVIDYVTIATTGNAVDFGDISTLRNQISACSDSHGGLGGF